MEKKYLIVWSSLFFEQLLFPGFYSCRRLQKWPQFFIPSRIYTIYRENLQFLLLRGGIHFHAR